MRLNYKSNPNRSKTARAMTLASSFLMSGCGDFWNTYLVDDKPSADLSTSTTLSDMAIDMPTDFGSLDLSKQCIASPKGTSSFPAQRVVYSSYKATCGASTIGDCKYNSYAVMGSSTADNFIVTLVSSSYMALSNDQFKLSTCNSQIFDSPLFSIPKDGSSINQGYNGCTFTFTLSNRTASGVTFTLTSSCP